MSPLERSFGKVFIYPQLKLYNYKNSGEATVDVFRSVMTYKTGLVAAPLINVGVNLVNNQQQKFFISGGGGMIFLFKNEEQEEVVWANNSGHLFRSPKTKLPGLGYNVNLSTGVTLKI